MTTESILSIGKAAREVGNKHLMAANPELVKHVHDQRQKEFEAYRKKKNAEIAELKDVIAANDAEIEALKAAQKPAEDADGDGADCADKRKSTRRAPKPTATSGT